MISYKLESFLKVVYLIWILECILLLRFKAVFGFFQLIAFSFYAILTNDGFVRIEEAQDI